MQWPVTNVYYVIRAAGDPAQLLQTARQTVSAADPKNRIILSLYSCGKIVLTFNNGYNKRRGQMMSDSLSDNLEAVLEAALRLTPDEQRQLAEQLPAVNKITDEARLAQEAEWLAIVEETRGTIKGLDRETIIWLAEDEELCGY